jgi:hypothetical protein
VTEFRRDDGRTLGPQGVPMTVRRAFAPEARLKSPPAGVRRAIRRHLAYPPRDAVPALPDGVRSRGRPTKAGGAKGKK